MMLCQQMETGESFNHPPNPRCLQTIRSPSPPPQYDNFGRRVNTREYRYRKRLEDERHKQIEKAMKIIPNYHPPSDYRRPTKTQEKVYVPVNDYPEINFSMITKSPTPLIFIVSFLSFFCNSSVLSARLAIFTYDPSTNTNLVFPTSQTS
jgi:hypothetical protein